MRDGVKRHKRYNLNWFSEDKELLLLNYCYFSTKEEKEKKTPKNTKSKQKQNKNHVVGIEGIWRLLLLFLISFGPPLSPSMSIQHHSWRLGNFSLFCVHLLSSSHFALFLDVSFAWDSLPGKADRQRVTRGRERAKDGIGKSNCGCIFSFIFINLVKAVFEKLYIQQRTHQNGVQCCQMLIQQTYFGSRFERMESF